MKVRAVDKDAEEELGSLCTNFGFGVSEHCGVLEFEEKFEYVEVRIRSVDDASRRLIPVS